jgi:hypothetical protein
LALLQRILGPLVFRDVGARPLILIQLSFLPWQKPIAPFLPANRTIGGKGPVPVGDTVFG